jgi:hypothetical protein
MFPEQIFKRASRNNYHHLSRNEIGGAKRISRHLSNFLPELTDDYFRGADHTPGIVAAVNGTFVRLRDHNQPVGVRVAFPGIPDLGERNTLGLDPQCAAGYAVHHLLESVREYVPRRYASGS